MKIHWNEFYEVINVMIEVGQVWPSRYARDFSTKITLIFHSHYHRLLSTTKQTEIEIFPTYSQCFIIYSNVSIVTIFPY